MTTATNLHTTGTRAHASLELDNAHFVSACLMSGGPLDAPDHMPGGSVVVFAVPSQRIITRS